MANGTFRLKGKELIEAHGTNLHKASQKGEFSYPTVHRYINAPAKVKAISMHVLYGFLVDGLGISVAELSQMKFGDIFDIVTEREAELVE